MNLAEEPEYCEKFMYAQKEKRRHYLAMGPSRGQNLGNSSECVWLQPAHEPIVFPSGTIIKLEAGSRITLVAGVYHEFYPLSDECIIGEVSTASDEQNDSFFVNPTSDAIWALLEDVPAIMELKKSTTLTFLRLRFAAIRFV